MARKDYTGAGMSRLLANYARAADMAGEITISDFAAAKIRKLLAGRPKDTGCASKSLRAAAQALNTK